MSDAMSHSLAASGGGEPAMVRRAWGRRVRGKALVPLLSTLSLPGAQSI